VYELAYYLRKAQSAVAQANVGMVELRFFCRLLREERQKSYTLQPRTNIKKGLAITLATAIIASPPLATRSNPHGFYKRTKNVQLGQSVFTLSGALGLSPSYWRGLGAPFLFGGSI